MKDYAKMRKVKIVPDDRRKIDLLILGTCMAIIILGLFGWI